MITYNTDDRLAIEGTVIVDEMQSYYMKAILSALLMLAAIWANAQVKRNKDSIKVVIPKDKSFNPANPKLRNSKIKTPVYNNNLTGTNAPGDANTGIPADNINHRPNTNAAMEKIKDSAAPNN
ncbi:MAG: hypothetical protein ABIN36_10875 [Ferruginibacter sp.]